MSPAAVPRFQREIARQFTRRMPIYDRRSAWIMDPGLLGAMVGACTAPRDARLLDVCCGTGAVGGAFAGRVARRIGVDLTGAVLREIGRTRLDAATRGNALSLPFCDGAFGVVVLRQALHFFDEPARAIAEMARVLGRGGQMVLGQRVPYGDADTAWMAELNRLKQPNLRTFILERHLVDGMRAAGLADVAVIENYRLWESINAWVESPEVPPEHRERILDHCRLAPAEVLAVHPIVVEGADVRCCWRWAVATGLKPIGE